MMKILLSIALGLVCSQLVLGQVKIEYVPGMIVLNNGDSIGSKILDLPFSKLSRSLVIEKSNSIDTLTASEIQRFQIYPDRHFERITIPLENGKVEDRFALLVISGEIDFLVLHKRMGGKRFFIRNDLFGVEELVNPRSEMVVGEMATSNKKYITTLAQFTLETQDFLSEIVVSNFNEKSLANLILSYNTRYSLESLDLRPEEKLKTSLILRIGLEKIVDKKWGKGSWTPNLGIGLTLFRPMKSQRLEFVTGLRFSKYRVDGFIMRDSVYLRRGKEIFFQKKIDFAYESSIVSVPLLIRLNYKLSLVSPLFDIGASILHVDSNLRYSKPSLDENFTGFTIFPTISLGVGVNKKKIIFEYRIKVGFPFILHSWNLGYRLY